MFTSLSVIAFMTAWLLEIFFYFGEFLWISRTSLWTNEWRSFRCFLNVARKLLFFFASLNSPSTGRRWKKTKFKRHRPGFFFCFYVLLQWEWSSYLYRRPCLECFLITTLNYQRLREGPEKKRNKTAKKEEEEIKNKIFFPFCSK